MESYSNSIVFFIYGPSSYQIVLFLFLSQSSSVNTVIFYNDEDPPPTDEY